MIAYCGLICDTCPIHLATIEPERSLQHELRESIARICTEQYGMKLKLDDINDCDGCRIDGGRLFSGCSECKVRKCATVMDVENCAFCSNFACEILQEHFLHDQDSRTRLEEIRNKN